MPDRHGFDVDGADRLEVIDHRLEDRPLVRLGPVAKYSSIVIAGAHS